MGQRYGLFCDPYDALNFALESGQEDFFVYVLDEEKDLDLNDGHEGSSIMQMLAAKGMLPFLKEFARVAKARMGAKELRAMANVLDHKDRNTLMTGKGD